MHPKNVATVIGASVLLGVTLMLILALSMGLGAEQAAVVVGGAIICVGIGMLLGRYGLGGSDEVLPGAQVRELQRAILAQIEALRDAAGVKPYGPTDVRQQLKVLTGEVAALGNLIRQQGNGKGGLPAPACAGRRSAQAGAEQRSPPAACLPLAGERAGWVEVHPSSTLLEEGSNGDGTR